MKKREIEQCIKRAVEQSVPDVLEQAAKELQTMVDAGRL